MPKRSRGSGKKDRGKGWELVRDADVRSDRGGGSSPETEPETVRLRIEKRRGNSVTVLATSGFDALSLEVLLGELKTRCASGGTRRGAEIELQGDHRERVAEMLRGRGVLVRGA